MPSFHNLCQSYKILIKCPKRSYSSRSPIELVIAEQACCWWFCHANVRHMYLGKALHMKSKQNHASISITIINTMSHWVYLLLVHRLDSPLFACTGIYSFMDNAKTAFAQFPTHGEFGFNDGLIVHTNVWYKRWFIVMTRSLIDWYSGHSDFCSQAFVCCDKKNNLKMKQSSTIIGTQDNGDGCNRT